MENTDPLIPGAIAGGSLDITTSRQMLAWLEEQAFIQRYVVAGKRYILILEFVKHQNPHKNERDAGSTIPDIDEKDNEINELKEDGKNRDKDGTTRADSLFPLPDSLILIPDTGIPQGTASPAKKAKGAPSALPDWLPLASWNGYLEMRKKIKKPPTDRAITLLLDALEVMRTDGQDIAAVLDKSTVANWTDVYPAKGGAKLPTQAEKDYI